MATKAQALRQAEVACVALRRARTGEELDRVDLHAGRSRQWTSGHRHARWICCNPRHGASKPTSRPNPRLRPSWASSLEAASTNWVSTGRALNGCPGGGTHAHARCDARVQLTKSLPTGLRGQLDGRTVSLRAVVAGVGPRSSGGASAARRAAGACVEKSGVCADQARNGGRGDRGVERSRRDRQPTALGSASATSLEVRASLSKTFAHFGRAGPALQAIEPAMRMPNQHLARCARTHCCPTSSASTPTHWRNLLQRRTRPLRSRAGYSPTRASSMSRTQRTFASP